MPETDQQNFEKLDQQVRELYFDFRAFEQDNKSSNYLILEVRFEKLCDFLPVDVLGTFTEAVKSETVKSIKNPSYLNKVISFLQTLPNHLPQILQTMQSINRDKLRALVIEMEEQKKLQARADLAAKDWTTKWEATVLEHNKRVILSSAQNLIPAKQIPQDVEPAVYYANLSQKALDEAKKIVSSKTPQTRLSAQREFEQGLRRLEKGLPKTYSNKSMENFFDIAMAAAIAEEKRVELIQQMAYVQAKADQEILRLRGIQPQESKTLSTASVITGLSNTEVLVLEAAVLQQKAVLFNEAPRSADLLTQIQTNHNIDIVALGITPQTLDYFIARTEDAHLLSRYHLLTPAQIERLQYLHDYFEGRMATYKAFIGPTTVTPTVIAEPTKGARVPRVIIPADAIKKITPAPISIWRNILSATQIRFRRFWDRMMLSFKGFRLPFFIFTTTQQVIASTPVSGAISGTLNQAAQGILSFPARMSQFAGAARRGFRLGGTVLQTTKTGLLRNPIVVGIIAVVFIIVLSGASPSPFGIQQTVKTQLVALTPPNAQVSQGLNLSSLAAGTCPVSDPKAIQRGTFLTPTGHGTEAYWQAMGNPTPRYPIPDGGLYSGCNNSSCPYYGLAIDVRSEPISTARVIVPYVCPQGGPCPDLETSWRVENIRHTNNEGDGIYLTAHANGHEWRILLLHVDYNGKTSYTSSTGNNEVGVMHHLTYTNNGAVIENSHVHFEITMDGKPINPTPFCDGSAPPVPGSTGGGPGGGTCVPPVSGDCSVANLKNYFGDETTATNFAKICSRESGGVPNAMNINCLTGRSFDYSMGLFQINLLAHPAPALMPTGLRNQINAAGYTGLSCTDAFTINRPSCSKITGRENLIQICENWFTNPAHNIEYAKSLYDLAGYSPWSGAAYCQVP